MDQLSDKDALHVLQCLQKKGHHVLLEDHPAVRSSRYRRNVYEGGTYNGMITEVSEETDKVEFSEFSAEGLKSLPPFRLAGAHFQQYDDVLLVQFPRGDWFRLMLQPGYGN